MEKFILMSVAAALFLFGCKKDPIPETDLSDPPATYVNSVSNYYENWDSDLESTDGILQFKSWDHFSTTNEEILLMSFEEVKDFEDRFGFYSQRTILKEILLAEEKVTDDFYAPYSHLSDDEIYALNLEEPKSKIYKEAVANNLITVEEDSREAHTYHLSVVDGTAAPLINAEGFVMVADTLWQYTSSQIKFCTSCTISDRAILNEASTTDHNLGIVTFTIKTMNRDNCSWDGNLNKGWNSTGDKRRARFERHGYSSTSDNCDNCFMIIKYYLHNEAQRKRWGKWKYRSSYKPWFRWDGTWSGNGNFWYCTNDPGAPPSFQNFTFPLTGFSVPIGVKNTPMSNRRYSGNNDTAVKLHPHSDGQWPPPPNSYPPYNASKCWGSCLDVYNISIDGKLVESYANPVTTYQLTDG